MKKILFATCMLFLFQLNFAQEKILLLKNRESSKVKTVLPGQLVRIKTLSGNHYKGNLEIFQDSLFVLASDTIHLNQVVHIRSFTLGTTLAGSLVAGTGLFFTSVSLAFLYEMLSAGGIAMAFGVGIGIPFSAITTGITGLGFFIIVMGKKYKKEKWAYSIQINNKEHY